MPKVSVVIPTYNRASDVTRAVDSVLAQTFHDYEVIVVDDGSTDETREVLSAYGDGIRYIYQENQERSVARNNGISMATGEYVAFLDSDDIWLPGKLALQTPILDRNPEVGLVYGQMFPMDPDGKWHLRKTKCTGWGEPGPARIFDKLVMGNLIPTPTVVVRKRCLDQVGGFDPSFSCSEDWDLWLRVSMYYDAVFVPQPLAGATFYAEIATRRFAYRSEENRTRILEKTFSSLPDHLSGSARLKPLALARRHLDAAYLHYAMGEYATARRSLVKAISLDPSIIADKRRVVEKLVEYGYYLAGASAEPTDVVPFVEAVLDNLPPSAQEIANVKSQAIARVYAVDAFERYELRDLPGARKDILRAAFYDRSVLGDRGVRSILAQSIIGKGAIDWARRARGERHARLEVANDDVR